MNIKETICEAIRKLKNDPNAKEKQYRIQKLQQLLDTSEKYDKNNSANSLTLKAKNSTDIEKEIDRYLYNREDRI